MASNKLEALNEMYLVLSLLKMSFPPEYVNVLFGLRYVLDRATNVQF